MTIKNKLRSSGILIVATQQNPQQIIKKIEASGFKKKKEEIHKLKLITVFTKHYPYSFIVFSK